MLANKGACFRDMLVHHLVDELVGHVLGSEFILSTLSANIAKPGDVRMGLHTNQWWMPQPSKPDSNYQRASEISRNPLDTFIDPDPTLFETFSDALKSRLGFKVWNAYGRVESPKVTMVSPNPKRIGELRGVEES
ncbi:MAG: hypothetical protein ACJAVI_003350 [Candidatus Azotimanducaceae bacterium]|jgi:hypothetical protein